MNIKAYLTSPLPRWLALAAVGVSGAVSAGGTYLYLKRKNEAEFQARLDKEVQGTFKFYNNLNSEYATPQEALKGIVKNLNDESRVTDGPVMDKFRGTLAEMATAVEVVQVAKYVTDDETGDKIEVAHNVFTDAKDYEFDLEEEKKKRRPDRPYILEHDEFYESEYQAVTLTWYEGDEVLADEKDEHIPDIDKVVGEDNLLRFGAGSRDPNIIYVRNEKLEVDFEIVKNDGSYMEQVHGFIQHDDRPTIRRMRSYDE